MKNIPLLTLFPRVWLLALFALITNMAALTNHQIIAPHWEHSTNEAWNSVDGVWTHTNDEAWVLVPGKTLFDMCGAALYMPGAVSLGFLCYLTLIHLFYRETIDADTFSGAYVRMWKDAEPRLKLILTTVTRAAVWLGVAIIIAALAR